MLNITGKYYKRDLMCSLELRKLLLINFDVVV